MAVAMKSESKSVFVKEFLAEHPEGNVKAVNEAWTAAGMTGTIGDTLIYQTRADMGLSGKLRAKAKPKTAAKIKSPTKMAEKPSSPGKGMFVKEYLNDHPQGNVSAINAAWKAAGFKETISSTLINKLRALMGLTGNLRANANNSKPSPTGKKRGRPRKETTAAVNGKAALQPTGNWSPALNDMEVDIDRLIFKTMAIGDLTEIEDTLRRARRLLYAALNRG